MDQRMAYTKDFEAGNDTVSVNLHFWANDLPGNNGPWEVRAKLYAVDMWEEPVLIATTQYFPVSEDHGKFFQIQKQDAAVDDAFWFRVIFEVVEPGGHVPLYEIWDDSWFFTNSCEEYSFELVRSGRCWWEEFGKVFLSCYADCPANSVKIDIQEADYDEFGVQTGWQSCGTHTVVSGTTVSSWINIWNFDVHRDGLMPGAAHTLRYKAYWEDANGKHYINTDEWTEISVP
jgi:hypothetical protein